MPAWTIGIEIGGARIDGEGLVRLENVFKREFPEYDAKCAMWSGWLGVDVTVRSATPTEALDSALTAVSTAFDEAGIDVNRVSEVTKVAISLVEHATSQADSLSRALLRLVSPSPRESPGHVRRNDR